MPTEMPTCETPRSIQEHPAYHEGFYEAQEGEPLFDDAAPEYAAGWRAYWTLRERIAELPHSGITA